MHALIKEGKFFFGFNHESTSIHGRRKLRKQKINILNAFVHEITLQNVEILVDDRPLMYNIHLHVSNSIKDNHELVQLFLQSSLLLIDFGLGFNQCSTANRMNFLPFYLKESDFETLLFAHKLIRFSVSTEEQVSLAANQAIQSIYFNRERLNHFSLDCISGLFMTNLLEILGNILEFLYLSSSQVKSLSANLDLSLKDIEVCELFESTLSASPRADILD
jgi:hypothetical protein